MKKVLSVLVLSLACVTPAIADHDHYYNRGRWVAPFIGGAVVGGLVTREYYRPYNYQPYYVPAPVIVQPQVVLPPPPYGFHYENLLDARCNCYRSVLVQN